MTKEPNMIPRELDISNTPGAFDLNSLLRRKAENAAAAAEKQAEQSPPALEPVTAQTVVAPAEPAAPARPGPRTQASRAKPVRAAGRPRHALTTTDDDPVMRLRLPRELQKAIRHLAVDMETDPQSVILMAMDEFCKSRRRDA
jgi:hypothetical protein